MAKLIPQHNIKKGFASIIHHLNNYDEKHDMADSCTWTFEIGQKMEGSAAKTDCTTEFLSSRGIKSTIHLSNSNTIKIWACRNLLDSPWFSKDSVLWADWISVVQIMNLIFPSWSLRYFETFECKLSYILTLLIFSLQGIWKIPLRFYSAGNLQICCLDGDSDFTTTFPAKF